MKLMIINPDWGVTGERMRQELKQLSAFVSPDTTLDMECLQRTRVYLDSPADAVWAGPEIAGRQYPFPWWEQDRRPV